jgi:carbonic anhydrase/acetyltransferase-like protein (isoleucine patch superfamily)
VTTRTLEDCVPIYAFDGLKPRIARSAYVHPDAVVIGDVVLGERASVWPLAVLRGDFGSIAVGARTSVQDGTVVHTTRAYPTRIGADCVVGHNAHLEGCIVEDHCLVGSMSTVLNRAVVGAHSVVAACTLVTEGRRVPPHSMVSGVPGHVMPLEGDDHVRRIAHGVEVYVENARRYPDALKLIAIEDCTRS